MTNHSGADSKNREQIRVRSRNFVGVKLAVEKYNYRVVVGEVLSR